MDEKAAIALWVKTWKEAGPELERVRWAEVRRADNVQVLADLEIAFNHATGSLPARDSSGLVEMQRILAKVRR